MSDVIFTLGAIAFVVSLLGFNKAVSTQDNLFGLIGMVVSLVAMTAAALIGGAA